MTGFAVVTGDIKPLWSAHQREGQLYADPVCPCSSCMGRAEARLVQPFEAVSAQIPDHTLIVGAGPFCPDVVRAAAALFAHGKIGPHLTFVGNGILKLHPLAEAFADSYDGYVPRPFGAELESEYMARLFPDVLADFPVDACKADARVCLPEKLATLNWGQGLPPEARRPPVSMRSSPIVVGIVAMPQVMFRAVDSLMAHPFGLRRGIAGLVTHLVWPELAGCSRQNWQKVKWATELMLRENKRLDDSHPLRRWCYDRTLGAVRRMNGVGAAKSGVLPALGG